MPYFFRFHSFALSSPGKPLIPRVAFYAWSSLGSFFYPRLNFVISSWFRQRLLFWLPKICFMLTSNFEMQTSIEHTDVPKWIISELKMWNKEESMWLRIATIYTTSMYRLISSIKWRRHRSLTLFSMSIKFNFQCKKKRKNVEESECRFIETLRLNKICIRNTEEWISHDSRFVYAFFFHVFSINSQDVFGVFLFDSLLFSSSSASVFYFVAQEH